MVFDEVWELWNNLNVFIHLTFEFPSFFIFCKTIIYNKLITFYHLKTLFCNTIPSIIANPIL